MADDGYSASELRRRYHDGGSVPDSDLSASQLRARKGIPSNSKDFATRGEGSSSGTGVIIVAAVLVVVGLIAYFVLHK